MDNFELVVTQPFGEHEIGACLSGTDAEAALKDHANKVVRRERPAPDPETKAEPQGDAAPQAATASVALTSPGTIEGAPASSDPASDLAAKRGRSGR